MTYRELYEIGKGQLTDAGVQDADIDARLILEYICKTNRNYMYAHGDEDVTAEIKEKYDSLVQERGKRIPLQHITGIQEFMGLEFHVNQDVLIPRQETEILVEEVLRETEDGMSVLDICTGSGCIILSIVRYKNGIKGVATDISDKALEVARKNAIELGGEQEICFVKSNMFENSREIRSALQYMGGQNERLEKGFDVLVANPPYIKTHVIESLEPEVKEHEPWIALDGAADGLYFYRIIADKGREFLNPGGRIYFEIGLDLSEDVSRILTRNGFKDIQIKKDFSGIDRVICARI